MFPLEYHLLLSSKPMVRGFESTGDIRVLATGKAVCSFLHRPTDRKLTFLCLA